MLALLVATGTGHAEPTLCPLFSDHMVLQQGTRVPVWGRADPGETVSIRFKGQTKEATADAAGKWTILLDPLPSSAEPANLVVASSIGHRPSAISNVLVGDVWVASGQSNMEFPVEKSLNASNEIAAADLPEIRQFRVLRKVAVTPQETVGGAWQVCNPQTVGKFSAVAFFFAREIHRKQNIPIGIIHCSAGWTPAEAWMSREALRSDPDFAYILDRWDEVTAEAERAKAEGRKPRQDPLFLHRASGFWNGGIAPLIPYAIRGVIWYQGETNETRGHEYRKLFRALIADWRRAWNRPDLPFLFVQVANVLPPDPEPVPSEWAELRESQALALALPRTGMAVTIDIGEEKDVHPKNKQEVGRRLALIARVLVYGEDLVYSGPIFKGMKNEGSRIRCEFEHVGGGLMTPNDAPLRGFAIAGADRRFVNAQAKIKDDAVVVWNDRVPQPVAVRYAWANNPAGCNLYNRANLPASPFRTDDWPGKTDNCRKLFIDP
jgi:sialate O-acetylesterase